MTTSPSTAGGETTAVALYMFFLMMCLHPDVQRRAQAEIDEVVGRDRLPTFEDKDKMPYLEALTKEVLRQHVPVPTGLPHSTTEDDIHDGWYIPKGSLILANIWWARYKILKRSIPNASLALAASKILGIKFLGLEKGRLLANATLFITFSMCLSAFDIAPVEVDGKVMLPEYKTKTGTVSHLEKFSCRITPRFSEQKLSELLHL
ncbi:hypothetical protein MPER_05862 [Moniliophthora perniciosa FA553]|nr:hypothetical protein MPER_05862 [Moniliophthora perniciosa FA553]